MFCLDDVTEFDDRMQVDRYTDKQYETGNWEQQIHPEALTPEFSGARSASVGMSS
jgi:hypothetical protein